MRSRVSGRRIPQCLRAFELGSKNGLIVPRIFQFDGRPVELGILQRHVCNRHREFGTGLVNLCLKGSRIDLCKRLIHPHRIVEVDVELRDLPRELRAHFDRFDGLQRTRHRYGLFDVSTFDRRKPQIGRPGLGLGGSAE